MDDVAKKGEGVGVMARRALASPLVSRGIVEIIIWRERELVNS
jgi:hypothetical protein